jgi:phage shock protein A
MLNDARSVEYREFVPGVIAALEEQKRCLQQTIRRIDRRLPASPEQAEQLIEEKVSAGRDLARIDHHLSRAAGGEPL